MYRRPFSSGSSSYTGSSTDTTTSGGSLKKTMFQTYEGQKCSEWSALPDCMLNPVITIDMAIVMENRASEHMHYILIGPSVLTVGFSETTLGCFQPPGCRWWTAAPRRSWTLSSWGFRGRGVSRGAGVGGRRTTKRPPIHLSWALARLLCWTESLEWRHPRLFNSSLCLSRHALIEATFKLQYGF